MKSIRFFTCSAVAAILLSAGAVRAADESPFKFEFHGFVTGSLYMQNQTLNAGGQGLLFFAPAPANAAPCKTTACDNGTFTAGQATKSGTYLGGDIRQSRYIFVLSGPKVFGDATPKAYFEGDLFGGTTAPATSPLFESWLWRIRAAYAEVKWDNFILQAGQHSAQLAFAMLPDSVSHIANPYTFGAGNFGWRTMGFRGFYTVPMGDNKFEIAVGVAQPTWADNNVPGAAPTTIGSGMANGIPELEARLRLEGKSGGFGYNVYADGLYQGVDLKGFGTIHPNGVTLADGTVKTSATVDAVEVGGKFSFSPVFVQGNFYTGKGLGSIAGALLQQGEIGDTEFYVQAGVNLTKEFSVNGTYGQASVSDTDLRNWAAVYPNANPKKGNQLIAAQAKYLDGGYAFAFEFIRYATKYIATATYNDVTIDGYQLILTGAYFF